MLQVGHQSHKLSAVVEQQQGIVGQIVQQAGRLRIEVRDIPFLAFEAGALAQLLALSVELVACGWVKRAYVQRIQQILRARAVTWKCFAGRADQHLADAACLDQSALGRRIEQPQAVDLVAKEFDTHRPQHIGRPDVDDAAAPAKQTHFLHHRIGSVAHAQPAHQTLVHIEHLADAQRLESQTQLAVGERLLHQSARRGDDQERLACRVSSRKSGNATLTAQQRGQRAHARLPGLTRPGNALVGQRIGIGQKLHTGEAVGRRQPHLQLVVDLPRLLAASDQQHRDTVDRLGQSSHQIRPRRGIDPQRSAVWFTGLKIVEEGAIGGK